MAAETADFNRANFHVVIVGAGLVGLASAIFLRKAGYRVTVLERDVELREVN
jgi:phytoene dehydrogenase-like protein